MSSEEKGGEMGPQAKKITAAELRAVQAAFAELRIAEAKLQGVLLGVAAGYDLPHGTQIDPNTGEIMLPETTEEWKAAQAAQLAEREAERAAQVARSAEDFTPDPSN